MAEFSDKPKKWVDIRMKTIIAGYDKDAHGQLVPPVELETNPKALTQSRLEQRERRRTLLASAASLAIIGVTFGAMVSMEGSGAPPPPVLPSVSISPSTPDTTPHPLPDMVPPSPGE